jgi:uncharacterized Ntn-hydrolase superfamily protein
MTYTVLGYCPRTDQVGIGLTTVTIAAGGTCPFYSYGGDIIVVQAYGNQGPAIEGARAADEGLGKDDILARMAAVDPSFHFRQVGVMRRSGEAFAVTGEKARPWAGHVVAYGLVAMGNVLAGPEVVQAMATAFQRDPSLPLAERLLQALEAGRDAGGQKAGEGLYYDERSALLRIIGDGPDRRGVTTMDLRVDMHAKAVDEMRRFYELYKPVIARRELRAKNPADDMATYQWEAENMQTNPPPPALKS